MNTIINCSSNWVRVNAAVFFALIVVCLFTCQVEAARAKKPPGVSVRRTVPTSLQLTSSSAQPVFVDSKTGKILWTANVQSAEASTLADGTLMSQMENVDGILYEQGKPAAKFSAPKVTYDDLNKTVTAHGGVKIRSLIQKDTTLTCDNVTWYPKTDKLIGKGNVVMTSGKFSQSGPSFQADTKLKDVKMHGTASQPIRIKFQP